MKTPEDRNSAGVFNLRTLVKYCITCGKENLDQAVFCVACGARFPDQLTPTVQPQVETAVQSSLFTAEMGTGAHEHILTDVYLKDQSGKLLLVARKQSLLHQNYTIVDGSENVTGYIEHNTHLTHSTMSFQDSNHATRGSVQIGSFRQGTQARMNPPNVWLEDAAGSKLGAVMFTNGILAYSVLKVDGSRIFDASFSGGDGLRQSLSALEHKSYVINLVDAGFELPWLLTIVAAVDHISAR